MWQDMARTMLPQGGLWWPEAVPGPGLGRGASELTCWSPHWIIAPHTPPQTSTIYLCLGEGLPAHHGCASLYLFLHVTPTSLTFLSL